jgi:putative oxidoreductase
MVDVGFALPVLATATSIFMELPVIFAVAVGPFARPAAGLMTLYSLGTALIGHRYWTVKLKITLIVSRVFTKTSA